MTNKQKAEKLVKLLDTVSRIMSEAPTNAKLWEMEEPVLLGLLAQLGVIIKRANELLDNDSPRSIRKSTKRNKSGERSAETHDDWPDVLSD